MPSKSRVQSLLTDASRVCATVVNTLIEYDENVLVYTRCLRS
jgi:hypothetical protein